MFLPPRLFTLFVLVTSLASAAPDGAELYQQRCALCHGATGQGVAGVFPPLAGADFLTKEREKSLRAPLEGLQGKIVVNGRTYQGAMPPVILRDEELAAVFGHIFTSWGNATPVPAAAEIATLRAKTKFPTFAALETALGGGTLPTAPSGWTLRGAVELNFSPVRLAAHPDEKSVLILQENGDVWRWPIAGGEFTRILEGTAYLDPALGRGSVLGFTVDQEKRLYLTSNQRNDQVRPIRNEVTIARTAPWTPEHGWDRPVPWLRTSYPWGVGPYNHGVSHIAEGPDGFLYVNSGSRTDGGEAGTAPDLAKTGEDPVTAAIWRVNPAEEKPELEVFARGLRNSFGFCWDEAGRLVATENGPDAEAAEELNWIEHGRHYGFPFQFSDWTEKAYPHTPAMPEGLVITRPFRNFGPDAGGSPPGLSTFDPHSCPAGIVWLGADWPAPLSASFLTVRFGNLIKAECGFDLLQLHPDFTTRTTTVKRLLHPLGRPIDLLVLPGHRLLIAEYCRATTYAAGLGTPGRLLWLEPAPR
jgi:glucose/arabinose dehydrogenase/mono/diheme cytochrome c family protein